MIIQTIYRDGDAQLGVIATGPERTLDIYVGMNLGRVAPGLCLGGIFDLSLGSNIGSGGGNPTWVVGDTFLVRRHA